MRYVFEDDVQQTPTNPYAAPQKSPQEIKGMTLAEKMAQAEALNTEREYLQSAGFTKSALSGATLGASELIPGFKPEEGELLKGVGEFAGSTLPVTASLKLFSAPLKKLASASPVYAKYLQSLGNIVSAGAAGTAVSSGEQLFKKGDVSLEDALTHGAQWSVLDTLLQSAGMAGRFVKAMVSKAKSTGKNRVQIANEFIENVPELRDKAWSKLSNLTSNQQEQVLESGIRAMESDVAASQLAREKGKITINPERFKAIENKFEPPAKPVQPHEFKFEEAENSFPKQKNPEIEAIAPGEQTEKILGENIQKDIQQQFKKAESEYNQLYDQVEQGSKDIIVKPNKTLNIAENTLKDLDAVKTKPEGYKKVISTLEDIIEDLGVKPISSTGFKGHTVKTNVPLPRLMELGRRLNKIINYDIIERSVQDKLKPIVRAVKEDIRQSLASKHPDLRAAYELAEEQFGKTAEKFSSDLALKIRGMDMPEKIGLALKYPSAIQNIKKIVSPSQFAQIERAIVEKVDAQGYDGALKYYNEVKSQLSPDSRKVVDKILKEKHPKSRVSQIDRIKKNVLTDLETSINSGQRPDKTLKLMRTQKGRKIVKESLNNNPQKNEILKYLDKQTFNDFASSIVDKSGKIDFKKLNDFMKDNAFIENIKAIGGEEAVTFLRQLENMSKQMERNLMLLEKIPQISKKGAERGKELLKKSTNKPLEARKAAQEKGQAIREKIVPIPTGKSEYGSELLKKVSKFEQPVKHKLESLFEGMGIPAKTVLGLTTAMTFGIPTTAIGAYTARSLYRLLSTRKAQIAFRHALSKSTNPASFLQALNAFDKEMKEPAKEKKERFVFED